MDDNSLSNPVASPTEAGTYSYLVFVIDANGCAGTDQMILTVVDTSTTNPKQLHGLSAIERELGYKLSLYPNPATNVLYADIDIGIANEEDMEIELFDLLGTKVYDWKGSVNGKKTTAISLEEMPSGTYHLRLSTENQSWTHKVVILK